MGMETTNHAGDAALYALGNDLGGGINFTHETDYAEFKAAFNNSSRAGTDSAILGNWIEEAGPVKPEDLDKVMHRFKNKPSDLEKWNESANTNPHIMRVYSFAEFKELETYPDRCQIYAHKDLRDTILKTAADLGYKNTAEVPRSECASILEFTNDDEPDNENLYVGPAVLFGSFVGANHNYTMKQWAQIAEYAKLVRVLTMSELKEDNQADENLIKLPKDFTL